MTLERPKVGIGALVVKEGKVLLGRRLASHGSGLWMIPGGHLEINETFEECATRELAEETGLTDVGVQGVVSLSNDIAYEKHYVTIGVLFEWKSGEPIVTEPDKSGEWYWADPRNLPEDMFVHSKTVIENWLSGKIYNI